MKLTYDERQEIINALELKLAKVRAGEYMLECTDTASQKDEEAFRREWMRDLRRLMGRIAAGR